MTEQIEKAAMWLSKQTETPQHVIHVLRENFGITATQAAQACTMANRFRAERRTRD